MVATVGARYQMVIERAAREKLGIKPGWQAVQLVQDGRLVVQLLPPEHNRSLAGIFHQYSRTPVDDDDWHEVKDAAWAAAVEDRWGRPKSKRRPG